MRLSAYVPVLLVACALLSCASMFGNVVQASASSKYAVQECGVPGTVPREPGPGGGGSGFSIGLGSGIAAAPDGTIWATRTDAALTAMTPRGKVRRVPLPEPFTATSLAVDRQGDVWYTFEGGRFPFGGIGEMSPSGQTLQVLDAAVAQGEDTWNVAPSAITEGPDGAMYFSESYLPEVGRVSGGEITGVPTPSQFANVTMSRAGRLWFAEYSSLGNIGARLEGDGTFTYFPGGAPPAAVSVQAVAPDADGGAWFAGYPIYGAGPPGPPRIIVTRVEPDGEARTFTARGSHGYIPDGVAVSADGAGWIASSSDHGPGLIWRISPNGEEQRIRATTMPTNQVYLGAITEGREGAMWYLDLSRGAIGRVSKPGLPSLKCKPAQLPPWAKKDYPNAK